MPDFGGQCGSKETRMAEQYISNMEEVQIQREMPVPRPYDLVEYRGLRQSSAPTRSIVNIPKFSGQDSENITNWMEYWNRSIVVNGWSVCIELVMSPLLVVGIALQHFRTIPIEISKVFFWEKIQKLNISLAEYYEDICCLVQRAWGKKSTEYQRAKVFGIFCRRFEANDYENFLGRGTR